MVNFRDPAVIAHDSLVLTKLWHTMGGLYFWEFFTTLGYEWAVIRGRVQYGWSIWIYSLARVAALSNVILTFILMNNRSPINCQLAISFTFVLSFLTMSASSLLIVLRVIAIWNRNRVVVMTSFSVWGINAAFFIQGVSRLRSSWAPVQLTCIPGNTGTSALSFIALLATDFTLFLIMLAGLFHLRCYGGATSGLIQILFRQGVISLLLATMAEVPPVVFILLNLNGPFNIMFQPLSWITMSIAATRMHRSLVDFASGHADIGSLPVRRIQETNHNNDASAPVDQMGVAVHTASEQYGTPQMEDNILVTFTDKQCTRNQAD